MASNERRLVIRTQLYIKVEIEHDDVRDVRKLGNEICRNVKKIYGVRSAEVQNSLSEDYHEGD
jgi:hypothetical protein